MTMMMTMLLFWNVELSVFVSPIGRERTVVVEEVLYTFRLVFIVRFSYGFLVPRRFGGFAQVLQTVQVAVPGRILTRPYVYWPHTYTPIRDIYHIHAQQDIRVCGDDHFQPPNWQYTNPKALWLLRVSI